MEKRAYFLHIDEDGYVTSGIDTIPHVPDNPNLIEVDFETYKRAEGMRNARFKYDNSKKKFEEQTVDVVAKPISKDELLAELNKISTNLGQIAAIIDNMEE